MALTEGTWLVYTRLVRQSRATACFIMVRVVRDENKEALIT
jgi:hypothetical protein